MVTGIEAAGLALAVFPIVVSGLKWYADGARTIKDMWRCEITLKKLSRELEMERCKFENTCTFLLEGMVLDSDLVLLMEIPGGPLWGADDFQERLEGRLRPATVPCYMEAVKELTSTLQILQDEFGPNGGEKPELTDRKSLKKKLKRIKLILSKAEYKEQLENITKINSDLQILTGQSKSVYSHPRMTAAAGHYQCIRNHARNLYGVLKEKLQASSACACTVPHNVNLQLEIRGTTTVQKYCGRDTSLRFHVVLSFEEGTAAEDSSPRNWREIGLEPLDSEKESWENKQTEDVDNSGCLNDKGSHTNSTAIVEARGSTMGYPGINIIRRLSPLPWGRNKPINISRLPNPVHGPAEQPRKTSLKPPSWHPESENGHKKTLRRVIFDEPQADCVDPASIAPDDIPRNTTGQIEDLCLAIKRAKNESSCLGVLIDGSKRQYRVWPPGTPLFTSEPISLESLLTRPEALNRKDRLILGVQLASTVMQLHATEWLSENWGKGDILFHQETTQGESGGVANVNYIIRKPFIRRIFASTGPCSLQPQMTTKSILVAHDYSLFSLGVVLVELWYGQHLEDFRIETDGNGTGGVTDMTDYMTVRRLIGKISVDAGERYGSAVRRCINGLDHEDSSLEVDGFKNEVHMKVVSPLVENLESFCDRKLQELL